MKGLEKKRIISSFSLSASLSVLSLLSDPRQSFNKTAAGTNVLLPLQSLFKPVLKPPTNFEFKCEGSRTAFNEL